MVDSEEQLPRFVAERALNNYSRAKLYFKMETPVTYFYTDRPRDVQVKVDMPRGLLTHWFPAVQAFGPPVAPRVKASGPGSFLDWGKVELFPDTPEFVGANKRVTGVRWGAGADSTWRFARDTDSALVKVIKAPVPVHYSGEVEKFLSEVGWREFNHSILFHWPELLTKSFKPEFDGFPKQRDHLLLVFRRAIGKAHSHAAKPESRNLQAALSEFALLHGFSSGTGSLIFRLKSEAATAVS